MIAKPLAKSRETVTPPARRTARVPAGSVVYAIGDIHGRADLLDLLHDRIAADAALRQADRKVAVYLGDYVDRGLRSKAVIDRLLAAPLPGFETVFLKGSHEDVLLKFLEAPESGRDWMRCGGLETLASYSVTGLPVTDDPAAFRAACEAFRNRLPPAHLGFFRALALWHVEGDYFFAHAGVRPGVALDRQSARDLMWIRDDFIHAREDFGKVVVHGHTPEGAPVMRSNRIGIDTGAWMTGMLTALALEEDRRAFLDTA